MGHIGRPRLSVEEKAKRGTLRAHRELEYWARQSGSAAVAEPAPEVVEALVPARDYLGIAAAYIEDVRTGRIIAGKWVKLACARQARDRMTWASAGPYVWDDDEAIAACHFLEQLPHVEGTWAGPLLVLQPWQVFLVSALYGWRGRGDRRVRRFQKFYWEVGRKSAKTTLSAGLAFYHLLREGEPGASVICGATTGSQARMVFGIMQQMGRRSSWLRRQGVEVLSNTILAPDGTARPINAKASSQDGLNPSCIVLDEGHAQDFELHNVLTSAQGARESPLLLCPTTAGVDLLSVGYALHQQAEKVLEGVLVNERLLCVIYALDEGDDWRDEATWIKANPMIGISPKLENVRAFAVNAAQVPGIDAEFLIKACSLWQRGSSAAISLAAWDKCADPALRLETFTGKKCWLGIDLGELDDLSSVALVFELGERLAVFVRSYLPSGVVEARARTVPAYRTWAEQGLLVPTEGTMTDYALLEADLRADCKRFQVVQGVFDYFGSVQICGNLAASGLPFIREPKNVRTCSDPAKEIRARVAHGGLVHDGNGHLRWAASNVHVTQGVDGSILFKKDTPDSANKIDPMDALVSAVGARRRAQLQVKPYQLIVLGGPKIPQAVRPV